MAQITWKNASSGSWQTGSNWTGGSVPGTGDDALLTPSGSYTVTSTAFVEVHSVQTSAGATLDISSGSFQLDAGTGTGANAGTILIENANNLTFGVPANSPVTINNTGTIKENASGNTTEFRLNAATVTLTGAGKVILSDSSTNYILAASAADTLVNVNNVISGSGQFGNGGMGLDNELKGTIDATGTINALVISLGGSGTNAGVMESTSSGGLVISNTVIDSTGGGKIEANGAGANVQLSGGTLRGGTLSTTGTGVIETLNGNGELDGTAGAVTNNGSLQITNDTVLYLLGAIDNTKTISETSTGNTTQFYIDASTVTLSGGGQVVMSNNTSNYIDGGFGNQLINVDNTISGAGNLGNGELAITNEASGIVDANTAAGLNVQTPIPLINAGLMEATAGGTLTFNSGTSVENAGGSVLANGGTVDLNSAAIYGGTLQSENGGVLQTSGGTDTLEGLSFGALTLSGAFTVTNATVLALDGVINDAGSTINLSGGGNTTEIQITGTATLQGGGALVMSNSSANYILSNSNSQNTLINVDNTISGTGHLGDGQLTLVNDAQGVIDANDAAISGSDGVLHVNVDNGVTNAGLMEATTGGTLSIESTEVHQTSTGVIAAKGANATVELNGADIIGGTLTTTGFGVVQVTAASTLDGLTAGAIANDGNLDLLNNTRLDLEGTITNKGTIGESSTGNATDLRLVSFNVTLQGGGIVAMSDNGDNRIYGASQWYTLDNVDNTISGAGQVGAGQMQLSNSGRIIATSAANQLIISLGNGSRGFNNAGGLWEGMGAAGLLISNGLYTNNGTVEALNSSSVTYSGSQGGVTNLNLSNGTLTGGTWAAISTGGGATISMTGGAVVTDAANLVLSGAGSVIQSLVGSTQTAIETTLTTVASGGSLALQGGRAYTTTLALSDSGTVSLAGAGTKLTAASLAVNSGGLLSGNGTVATSVTDVGTVTASGGLLDITKNLTGAGAATISANSTLEVDLKDVVKTTTFLGGAHEVLALKQPSTTTTNINGWTLGTTIDLLNIGVTKLSYAGNSTSGVLTVTSGTSTVAKLNFTGHYSTASFNFTSDNNNGTNIVGTGTFAADLTAAGGFDAAQWHAAAAGLPSATGLVAAGSPLDGTPGTPLMGYAPAQHG